MLLLVYKIKIGFVVKKIELNKALGFNKLVFIIA